jgi:hypothetical protein
VPVPRKKSNSKSRNISSAATLTLNEKKTVPRNVFQEKNGKVPGSGNKSIA